MRRIRDPQKHVAFAEKEKIIRLLQPKQSNKKQTVFSLEKEKETVFCAKWNACKR